VARIIRWALEWGSARPSDLPSVAYQKSTVASEGARFADYGRCMQTDGRELRLDPGAITIDECTGKQNNNSNTHAATMALIAHSR